MRLFILFLEGGGGEVDKRVVLVGVDGCVSLKTGNMEMISLTKYVSTK